MLRIYAQGVKAMKELGPQNPRSWTFQWYIHATPRSKDEIMKEVFRKTNSKGHKLASEVWYTCQSHLQQPNDYFLPWHRLYVLYFEEIIRNITGHRDFTLPYWDYTSPASQAIPEEFQARNKNDPLFSALFVPNRNKDDGSRRFADVNAGEPLNKHFRRARDFLVSPDMSQSNYSSFCTQLDSNLHGAIHRYTGDTTNMGIVPTAAGDPLFWLHHCNIDRIWADWIASGKRNPRQTNGLPWSGTKFRFVDGKGNRIEVAISTVADSSKLPYRYDNLPSASEAKLVLAQNSPSPERNVLLKSLPIESAASKSASHGSVAVPLGAQPQTVTLAPTAEQNKLTAAAPSAKAGGQTRFILTLNKLQAHIDPNTSYEVFLDLPQDASPDIADQHYVGLVNFFGVARDKGHETHGGATVEFDVTGIVQRLGDAKKLKNDTQITLVPVGAPADGSMPVISGGIEIHKQ